MVKNPPAKAGDVGSIPGVERSPEGGYDNPFQYSCLKNAVDRGAWWATVHGVAKSQARLKGLRLQCWDAGELASLSLLHSQL